jgi:5-methylcytosine-specific restriction enzyme B
VAFLENTDAIHAATGDQVRRIQLHQACSYEQFIGGLKLTENGTELEEGYLPELVREIDETREKHNDDLAPLPWVLILDELNRTDLSRLLGEAFSVLDDRDTPIDLAGLGDDQERRTLSLPEDLFLVGTLNLIDQSVEQPDFARTRITPRTYCGSFAKSSVAAPSSRGRSPTKPRAQPSNTSRTSAPIHFRSSAGCRARASPVGMACAGDAPVGTSRLGPVRAMRG